MVRFEYDKEFGLQDCSFSSAWSPVCAEAWTIVISPPTTQICERAAFAHDYAATSAMPQPIWRVPRTAGVLQLAVLLPRLLRTYAAPTAAAAVMIGTNSFGDGNAAMQGNEPETPPGSTGTYTLQAAAHRSEPS